MMNEDVSLNIESRILETCVKSIFLLCMHDNSCKILAFDMTNRCYILIIY